MATWYFSNPPLSSFICDRYFGYHSSLVTPLIMPLISSCWSDVKVWPMVGSTMAQFAPIILRRGLSHGRATFSFCPGVSVSKSDLTSDSTPCPLGSGGFGVGIILEAGDWRGEA